MASNANIINFGAFSWTMPRFCNVCNSATDFFSISRALCRSSARKCCSISVCARFWLNKVGVRFSPDVFSEDHISAPRVCCTTKFLHEVENDQVLLADPPPGRGPLATFFKEESKIVLKYSVLAARTLEPKGVAS